MKFRKFGAVVAAVAVSASLAAAPAQAQAQEADPAPAPVASSSEAADDGGYVYDPARPWQDVSDALAAGDEEAAQAFSAYAVLENILVPILTMFPILIIPFGLLMLQSGQERVKLFVCEARFIGTYRSGRGRRRPFG